jgi:hypothetical protein
MNQDFTGPNNPCRTNSKFYENSEDIRKAKLTAGVSEIDSTFFADDQ